ncbi:MAG TPA: serine/threonine-protein kinase [Kofleriaceae bacterium]|nr:serine/threonine-protein kinase [Kofleriaceae bacterium]
MPQTITAPGSDPGSPDRTPERGALIGRFVVLDLLGEGGMAVVLSAYDPHLDRKVALKLLRGDRWCDERAQESVAAVVREAQAMARLSHPNVLNVHEIGFEGATSYVVMEHVDGRTLREWIGERERGWREILDMFTRAGDGLAAAHAAGIVHRDFKPENVLVGRDARPRVADFGVASAFSAMAGEGAAGVAGTCGYMAPEQLAGAAIDARADQYAFCVSLWEALRGALPPGDELPATSDQTPTWLLRTLARGLAARPEDRWPSMDELLATLRRRRARRRSTTLGIAVAGVLVAGAFGIGQRAATVPPCGDAEDLVAPLWSEGARARVEAAFVKTGRPYAADTFARVDTALRARLGSWARAHREVCEATHVRHEQSEAMLDLRMSCLRHARAEMTELVDLLGNASTDVLDHAVQATRETGDTFACASVGASSPGSPAPPDPAVAKTVEALRAELPRLAALRKLGSWKEGLIAARALVARARATGYQPLLASALIEQAQFDVDAGTADRAVDSLYEAAQLGAEARDDDLVAQATERLEWALLETRVRMPEAQVVLRFAVSATTRAGFSAARQADLLRSGAVMAFRQGDHLGSLMLCVYVLALQAATDGPHSFAVADALYSIAEVAFRSGHLREGAWVQRRAISLAEDLLGPDHPTVAELIGMYTSILLDLADFDEALPLVERMLTIRERAFGPEDPRLGDPLYNLAIVLEAQRRLPEARAAIERAIHIEERAPLSEQYGLGARYDELGTIAHHQGRLEEARRAAQKAVAVGRKLYGVDHPWVANSYEYYADHLLSLRRLGEARAAAEQALAICKKTQGEEHFEYAAKLNMLGKVLLAERRPREALEAFQRALAIYVKTLGPDHVNLGSSLIGLSDALLATGDSRRALTMAERAVELSARASPGELEEAQLRVAEAMWATGHDRRGAVTLARAARDRLAALPFPSEDLPRLDGWLARAR